MAWQNAPSGWEIMGDYTGMGGGPGITPGTSSSSSSGSSGGYKSQFGKLAGLWNDYRKMSAGTSAAGGDVSIPSPTAGSAGGHSITPFGSKGKKFLMQYINPTASILHGGPAPQGGGGGGGGGWKDIVGIGLSAASIFCDMRLKTDIAPLESTEVNDALAEVAFFVKGLRECA